MFRLIRNLIGIVVILGVLAEIAVIPLAQSQIEKQVAEQSEGETAVDADIDSFPLITRVLLTGEVKDLSVTLTEVARLRLTFADVVFKLHGIKVDRAAILQRNVKIQSIDSGSIEATVELGALGGVVSRLGEFFGGAGREVRVEDGKLLVGPTEFDLGDDLFPCDPDARVEEERVVLSCTITDVPDVLLDAAQTRF